MDPDLNKYDLEHAVTDHQNMTRAEWQAIYNEAWSLYYTREHAEVLLRRAAASGISMASLIKVLVPFITMVPLEGVHPLQAGLFRLKHPDERRPDMPRESLWSFYPRYILNLIWKNAELAKTVLWLLTAHQRDAQHLGYLLSPVDDDEEEMTLGSFDQDDGCACCARSPEEGRRAHQGCARLGGRAFMRSQGRRATHFARLFGSYRSEPSIDGTARNDSVTTFPKSLKCFSRMFRYSAPIYWLHALTGCFNRVNER
jgi:hypothetical protein